MKTIEFKTEIAANAKKVWDTMLNADTYRKWVEPGWPGSYYEGNWEEGRNMKFISPGQGGTMATITESRPHEYLLAKHIAVIQKDGSIDRESELARGWIGTTEGYSFQEKNGRTVLKIELNTSPQWEKMFTDGWPKALDRLKEMCESNN